MSNICILIDGENQSTGIKDAVNFIKTFGKVVINKVFGDINQIGTTTWRETCSECNIEAIGDFVHMKKSNSSDIKLTVEAIKILYTKKIDIFVIISSDSDFTSLISEIRSHNKEVIGICRKRIKPFYENSFDKIFFIEDLNCTNIIEEIIIPVENNNSEEYIPSIDEIDNVLCEFIGDKSLGKSVILKHLRSLYPTFKAGNYNKKNAWMVYNCCTSVEMFKYGKKKRFRIKNKN